MKRCLVPTIALLLAATSVPTAGRSAESRLQAAGFAWERGDYVAALTAYLEILDSPEADAALETIALRTGELFHTTELTTDGAAPQFAPDGKHLAYETGTGPERRVRLIATSAPGRVLAELEGWNAAFSPDGASIAYLHLSKSDELASLREAVSDAEPSQRGQRTAALNAHIATASRIVLREIATGREIRLDSGALRKSSLVMAADGTVLFAGGQAQGDTQIYSAAAGRAPLALTSGEGDKTPAAINANGTALLFTVRTAGPGRGGRGGGRGGGPSTFGVLPLPEGTPAMISGSAPSFSADGRTLTYVVHDGAENRLMIASVAAPAEGAVVRGGPERIDAPALSPDGSKVVFQMMVNENWEIFVAPRAGGSLIRLTREIQHDIFPRFLAQNRVLAAIGEGRHRRSHIYEVATQKRTRLFHNNTVRTIAPEYAWVGSADGTKILISAERDGNTVSTERGVYLVDLSRRVTRDELRARVEASLDAERALRAKGTRLYAPIAAAVKTVLAEASVDRVYSYEKALFDFDSKHITQPGNRLASEYLFNAYTSFGYAPEYQWFEARNALGGQTANVIAVLKGTDNPELIYVVSSHYDSVAAGPGADDDTSGTAALLEAARILAKHPQPATIVFASFTGEEAGLLGSREWVRRAVADRLKVVGALNNDMVGWANNQRLDNTIRYSNAGIRDIQHAAAMQFTNMITYDALYYKSTDAAAYYEAYGDIVGGIGSYPVLGNPHYHQPHDLLDTINHQLVTEVGKTTAATLMLLASSPSRLTNLQVTNFAGGTATLSWTPSPEKGVTGYIVAYGAASTPEARQVRVTSPTATLKGIAPGTVVAVKAVNAKGLEGWDWARVTVQ